MANRASGYTFVEDILLCNIYIQISQDPIVGRYQTANSFWERITNEFNNSKDVEWEVRSDRSLQSRWHTIEVAVRKMKACLRQIENRNPSGTQEHDRFQQAKILFAEEKKFKKGFKFDHVWNIVKDFPKFDYNVSASRQRSQPPMMTQSTGSENPTPEYLIPNLGLDDININLTSEGSGSGASSSKRPMGVKKSKLKKKNQELASSNYEIMEARNEQLFEMMKKLEEDRKAQMELQKEMNELRKKRDEDATLLIDLNSISNPKVREYYENTQNEILNRRRINQQQPHPPSSSTMPGFEFMNDFGSTGCDLPNYRDYL